MFRYEVDLVDKFIDLKGLQTNFIRECTFRWGNIDLVEYKTESINYLSREQINLLRNKENLHIFSLLYRKRPHAMRYLVNETKSNARFIKKKIDVLLKAEILKEKGNLITVNEEIDFPDISVIAYEMKLTDIKKALNQAVINKKYCDYSYVVMPISKYDLCMKHKEIFQECSVGLILVDNYRVKEIIRPRRIKEINFNKLLSKVKIVGNIEKPICISV